MKARLFILSFFALCTALQAYAQKNIYPANTTDQTCSQAKATATVNCDMIETPQHNGRLFAIAWDDDNANAFVKVFHNSEVYQNVTITLPAGATQPDVAIANATDAAGDFRIAVMYVVNTDVFLGIYSISGIADITMQAAEVSTIQLNTHAASHPHIDLFADKAAMVGGLPSLHRFGITWDEWDPAVNDISVNGRMAEIAKPTEYLWNIYIPQAVNPDITAYTDDVTGKQYLSVVYTKNQSVNGTGKDLRVLETEIDGFTNQFYFLEKGTDIASARIESQAFHYTGAPKWAVAAAVTTATPGRYDIKVYNDQQIAAGISAPLSNNLDNSNPAIAAGIGKTAAEGTDQYSVAFFPMYDSSLYLTSATQWGQAWPGAYYEANSTSMDVHSGSPAIAVNSSSNSGIGQLTAWYNGHNVVYTITDDNRNNNQAPTAVNRAAITTSISLYPNPASSTLHITGAMPTSSYTVTDVTGRNILAGTCKGDDPINVSSLLSGTYILSLQGKNIVTELRFVKQ